MLKRRLIPVLFLRNGFIVRSELFKSYKNIGNPILEAKRFNDWDVDELIYIDISEMNFMTLVGMITKQNSNLIFCQLWRKLQKSAECR